MISSDTVNAAICDRCDTLIVSRWRHDFVTCECGWISVDGGNAYHKRCFDTNATWREITNEELLRRERLVRKAKYRTTRANPRVLHYLSKTVDRSTWETPNVV